MKSSFAIVIPLANESQSFHELILQLQNLLNDLESGIVYLIVDNASRDNTLELCVNLSHNDSRFKTVYETRNKNVVDAYLRGFFEACKTNPDFIVEMDADLSHDPKEIPKIISLLKEGNDCVFGSRFIKGGSIQDGSFTRMFFSKFGTLSANLLLGTKLNDMTSGFQGFRIATMNSLLNYKFKYN